MEVSTPERVGSMAFGGFKSAFLILSPLVSRSRFALLLIIPFCPFCRDDEAMAYGGLQARGRPCFP